MTPTKDKLFYDRGTSTRATLNKLDNAIGTSANGQALKRSWTNQAMFFTWVKDRLDPTRAFERKLDVLQETIELAMDKTIC